MLNSLADHSPGNFYSSRESSGPWDNFGRGGIRGALLLQLRRAGRRGWLILTPRVSCSPPRRAVPTRAEGRGGGDRQQNGGGVTGQVTMAGDRMRSRLSVTQRAHTTPKMPG